MKSSMPFKIAGRAPRNSTSSAFVYSSRAPAPAPEVIRQIASESQSGTRETLSSPITCPFRAATRRSFGSVGGAFSGTAFGSISARHVAANVDFADPCSPVSARIGYGPRPLSAPRMNPTARVNPASSVFRNVRRSSIAPPATGAGSGSVPGPRAATLQTVIYERVSRNHARQRRRRGVSCASARVVMGREGRDPAFLYFSAPPPFVPYPFLP
jgi:hypothetical protein